VWKRYSGGDYQPKPWAIMWIGGIGRSLVTKLCFVNVCSAKMIVLVEAQIRVATAGRR